jgi:hypothetical protein
MYKRADQAPRQIAFACRNAGTCEFPATCFLLGRGERVKDERKRRDRAGQTEMVEKNKPA